MAFKNEHYSRGIALYDHGLYDEAIQEFERVLQTVAELNAPERKLASFYMGEAYANLGLSHLHMNMYQRAEEELKLAVMLHPEYADLHFYLGMVYYRQERYDEAEKELRRAVVINSRFAKALLYLGLARLHSGTPGGLESIAEAVAVESAYNNERYKRAISLYKGGDTAAAVALLEGLAETDLDQISYMLERGLELLKQKAYREATKVFLDAVSVCPHYADLRQYLGICYTNQGMFDMAIDQLNVALEINPDFTTARLNLAIAYEGIGQIDYAIYELEQVIVQDPDNSEARQRLTKLRESQQ